MIAVVIHFVEDPKPNRQCDRHPKRETGNIDKSMGFISAHIAPGDEEIVPEHRSSICPNSQPKKCRCIKQLSVNPLPNSRRHPLYAYDTLGVLIPSSAEATIQFHFCAQLSFLYRCEFQFA